MNARQTKKNLKRKIQKLESDNKLMKSIIEDHSEMLELYDLYNSPKFVTQTTMQFRKYYAQQIIPLYRPDIHDEHFMEMIKSQLAQKMLPAVKENAIFHFDIDKEHMRGIIRATLFLGRKDDLDNGGEDNDERRAGDSIFQRYEKKDVRGSFKNMP